MSRFKLQQIVRLREMLRKWRRLTHKAKSNTDRNNSSLSTTGEVVSGRTSSKVPPGHLAVYVGEERARFVIKTSLLGHPLFKALLRKTEEEIGFHYEGGLTLPCEVSSFQHLLLLMQSKQTSQNLMMAMMMTIHNGQGEHVDDGMMQEKNPHQGFLPLLRELLHLHITDSSAVVVNRCLARPPLISLPPPVF